MKNLIFGSLMSMLLVSSAYGNSVFNKVNFLSKKTPNILPDNEISQLTDAILPILNWISDNYEDPTSSSKSATIQHTENFVKFALSAAQKNMFNDKKEKKVTSAERVILNFISIRSKDDKQDFGPFYDIIVNALKTSKKLSNNHPDNAVLIKTIVVLEKIKKSLTLVTGKTEAKFLSKSELTKLERATNPLREWIANFILSLEESTSPLSPYYVAHHLQQSINTLANFITAASSINTLNKEIDETITSVIKQLQRNFSIYKYDIHKYEDAFKELYQRLLYTKKIVKELAEKHADNNVLEKAVSVLDEILSFYSGTLGSIEPDPEFFNSMDEINSNEEENEVEEDNDDEFVDALPYSESAPNLFEESSKPNVTKALSTSNIPETKQKKTLQRTGAKQDIFY